MCGRFSLSDATIREMINIVDEIDQRIENDVREHRYNYDVYPGNIAPVITKKDKSYLSNMIWGYPHFQNKGVIFNARSETVFEKKMFLNGVLENRAVIPATSFYEWDRNKRKNKFYRVDGDILYLAGIYDDFAGENRFVILTTEANDSMRDIHSRMPVLLERDEVFSWIEDGSKSREYLRKTPISLLHQDIEPQQSMFSE